MSDHLFPPKYENPLGKTAFADMINSSKLIGLIVKLFGDMLAKISFPLSGWRQDVPTDWIITGVTHSVGSDGWNMDVEAESLS